VDRRNSGRSLRRPRSKQPARTRQAGSTPGDGPLKFRATGQTRDYPLVLLNSILNKRYLVYLKVT
jgi:hypothetical protein